MNNHHNNSGNGFTTGLILGMILGAAAVFLFGTKRGRKLFKVITEEGFEGISEIGDIIEDVKEDDLQETNGNARTINHQETDQETVSPKSNPRRFFKGVHKR